MTKAQYYSLLGKVRPAQLGDFIKKCLRIERMYIPDTTGHIFWADPVSVFGSALFNDGIYEAPMTKLLQTVLQKSDTFVDIGGNEGYFSVLAASLVGQNGKVFCIEPQSRLKPVILRNLEKNACTDQVSICTQALNAGDTNSVSMYLRQSGNTGASSMFRHWKLGANQETVRATSLDQFWSANHLTRAKLIKIDCEGAEYLVIDGAKDTLTAKGADFIAIDYHMQIIGKARCQQTHDTLIQKNYVLSKTPGLSIYHLSGLETQLKPLGELRTGCNWDE